MSTEMTAIIVGIFGGGAFFAFIQFLVNRYDSKKEKAEEKADKKEEILKEIKEVKRDVHDFKEELAKQGK